MIRSFHKPDDKACARSNSRGFTLIEVMIVVALISILAAVALPSYRDYVRRGQTAEAFSSLSDFRSKMEQYYQDNRKYGGTKCADDSTAGSWNTFASSEHFKYDCALDDAKGQSFTVSATGISGAVTGDVYTIDHNGNRATTVFKGATVTATCWLSRSTTC